MTLLSLNYFWLSICGCWRPLSWPRWASNLYHLYTFVALFDLISFMISGIMDIASSQIEMTLSLFDTLSLMISFTTVIMKVHCSVYFRDVIINIEKCLEEKLSKLNDPQEQMVFDRYRRITRNLVRYYSGSFLLVLIWYLFARSTVMEPPYVLPCSGWFPYNYSSSGVYAITAVYQLFAICNAAVTNLSFDPLLPCIFYYVCAHINILKLRFNTLLNELEKFNVNSSDKLVAKLQIEQKLISDWVDYHIEILSWTDTINVTFSKVVFIQYSFSSILLCTLAYMTAHTPIGSVDFIGNLTFFIVMYIQIYVQCVAADQMTVEFANVAVEVGIAKWFNLSRYAQKYMVIILAKSTRPVIFTCGFFLSLSLESFMKVIKLSYTIYNLLE